MPKIAVSSAIVRVTPQGDWNWGPSWQHKPGEIEVKGTADHFVVSGKPAVFEADLLDAIQNELKGRSYVASGYPQEGKVGKVSPRIEGEVTRASTSAGKKLALLGTSGSLIG